MTVNNVDSNITYVANGSTTEWVFGFPGVDASFISVFITDSVGGQVQLSPSVYQVVLNPTIGSNPTSEGGKVIFPIIGTPLGVGNSLTIVRDLPAEQSVSISNQSIIYPPIIEQEFDYLTLLSQKGSQDISRAFKVGFSDPIPALVPPVVQRANKTAFFDSQGNLTPGAIPGPGVFISAAMIPVVEAATLALARQLMGITSPTLSITATYVVTNSNNRQVLNLNGSVFFPVVVGAPSEFDSSFWVVIFNNDNRGKIISISGKADFILWPGQQIWVFQDGTGSGWMVTDPGRWFALTTKNFFVDPLLGNNSNDGLAPGNQAWRTIQGAVDIVSSHVDGPFIINLADGTHQVGAGVVCSKRQPGSTMYNFIGNVGTPSNVIVNCDPQGMTFVARDGAVINISGIKFTSTGGNGLRAIWAINSGTCYIGKVVFGQFTTASGFGGSGHLVSAQGGTIQVIDDYHVSGGGQLHLMAWWHSRIIFDKPAGGVKVTYDNAVNFSSSGNFNCYYDSVVAFWQTGGFINPGFLTGANVNVGYNAVVYGNGSGIPGSAGSVDEGHGGYWV
jgi:hypothetical protein